MRHSRRQLFEEVPAAVNPSGSRHVRQRVREPDQRILPTVILMFNRFLKGLLPGRRVRSSDTVDKNRNQHSIEIGCAMLPKFAENKRLDVEASGLRGWFEELFRSVSH